MARHLSIDTKPLAQMRYRTLGDYFQRDGRTIIEISDMGNEDYEFLISIHEQIEEYLTRKRGIPEPGIIAFDKMFEAERAAGKWKPEDEPGNDHRAPYRTEHRFAENIERILAAELGVDWAAYESFCASL